MPDLNSLILSILIFFPLVGAIVVALLPRALARKAAVGVALLNFIFSLHLLQHWNEGPSQSGYRFEQVSNWFSIPQFGISYHLGVDGLSVLLVLLTTLLTPLVLLAAKNNPQKHFKAFFVCFLL